MCTSKCISCSNKFCRKHEKICSNCSFIICPDCRRRCFDCFKRLDICNWYAEHLVRRFGYPETRDYGTAYCVPKSVNPNEVTVYD